MNSDWNKPNRIVKFKIQQNKIIFHKDRIVLITIWFKLKRNFEMAKKRRQTPSAHH